MRQGHYTIRFSETAPDIRAAQRLRGLCFLPRDHGSDRTDHGEALDSDAHDEICRHVLIEDKQSGTLVCCFRILPLSCGSEIARSYSAQYYNLSSLAGYDGKLIEMGRFCIHPEWHDPDILRVAWAALADYVETEGVELLFGCSSFIGTDPGAYADAFAMLRERHLAPKRWLPRVKAPQVFRFARALRLRRADSRKALAAMPPLLRSYLAMGGWVSDHAVVDQQLNTLHVFTGLEISAIPPARKRLLRGSPG
ncbi:GNAT family N-acetyltransferase [Paracoccus tegillarcae]|uniref:L-ornithine N(alpha)-acyltransferase n=1 Tax=Paracoccus tegillarcae TaxID=1529068 RepID=A0A2K9ET61_9RHOB|nr:GNAT family N-acetyltransferase [Paracoccus tegillarcae]AUH34036.1 ornithine-acyl-ACP acyltransferase [Paracoccus tegillarcae]